MARKRAENRKGSLGGFPGFVKPVFTIDSKPLGRRLKVKKITRAPRERETRTHLKKVSPLRGEPCLEGRKPSLPIWVPLLLTRNLYLLTLIPDLVLRRHDGETVIVDFTVAFEDRYDSLVAARKQNY
ncbi:hypothetical protein TNCV_3633391 [Trichonephila clavipes]|nr:hypothetical protein TNCV_3633391 [Trichonephila clavipes]